MLPVGEKRLIEHTIIEDYLASSDKEKPDNIQLTQSTSNKLQAAKLTAEQESRYSRVTAGALRHVANLFSGVIGSGEVSAVALANKSDKKESLVSSAIDIIDDFDTDFVLVERNYFDNPTFVKGRASADILPIFQQSVVEPINPNDHGLNTRVNEKDAENRLWEIGACRQFAADIKRTISIQIDQKEFVLQRPGQKEVAIDLLRCAGDALRALAGNDQTYFSLSQWVNQSRSNCLLFQIDQQVGDSVRQLQPINGPMTYSIDRLSEHTFGINYSIQPKALMSMTEDDQFFLCRGTLNYSVHLDIQSNTVSLDVPLSYDIELGETMSSTQYQNALKALGIS